ncbi:MAG: end-binding protein Ku [Chthoniobacter sp.]|jgi:DNA end-binding protein Ku|nr:end-binding protein Ku [Chthoniobacter sp.]
MRALWKGAITFGLVTIPVSLFPATRREELKFRLLRSSDQSPVNYKRVAEADGKEVPWDQIVKGYEYEKGKFVILKEEDFARVDVEATQTVDIMNFVSMEDVDPLLFYKPYYLEAAKGGDKAYVLLRDALLDTGKIAIAKVVIRTRQHLAAVKPQKKGLMLELMHFPKELIPVEEFNEPAEKAVGKAEMHMAKQLIQSMTQEWKPEQYNDEYHEALEKLIEEKIEDPDKAAPAPTKKRQATNVIDLVSVLQESLQQSKGKVATKKKAAPARKPAKRKKAA